MKATIGIFEAKTKLSEICSEVEERGAQYVITRRGRAVAKIVPIEQEKPGQEKGIRARMRRSIEMHGQISGEEPEFPDVWLARKGSRSDSLTENTGSTE